MARGLRFVLAAAAAVALLAVLRFFPPDRFAFYPACPFHALTGLLCPGCGGTRALAAMAAGRWADAWQLNPLIAVGAPMLAARALWASAGPHRVVIPARTAPYLLGIALAYSVLRNFR